MMQSYTELQIDKKINKTSFYVPCNSEYFNQWAKVFVLSAKQLVPWINIHCHIFDITEKDKNWCKKHNVTFTEEITPPQYQTIEEKKGYWVNVRFCRVLEIFDDSTTVMCVDADCVVMKEITEEEFIKDTVTDWVVVREKGTGSIGSCVVFSANCPARFIVKERLMAEATKDDFVWYLDQITFDKLIDENILQPFSVKYSDHRCSENNKIWTGKGNRKFKKNNKKRRYSNIVEEYQLHYPTEFL